MTARDGLQVALREHAVPVLQAAGFSGTYPTWRRADPSGDMAIVNVQSSPYNEHDFEEFYLNLAVVPKPWWIWTRECYSRVSPLAGTPGKQPNESHGLYRQRLAPNGTRTPGTYSWAVDSAEDARRIAATMAASLEQRGLPALGEFLDRAHMLEAVRSGLLERECPEVFDRPGMTDVILGVLLSDVGGPELDAVCDRLDRFDGAVGWREVSTATAAWARTRAGSATTS
jgi:hypothetical protein